MSGSAAVSAAIVAPMAGSDIERYAGLSALLAIEAGVIFILLGWWKAGFVSQFVAVAVQTGFLFGLGDHHCRSNLQAPRHRGRGRDLLPAVLVVLA